MVLMGQPLRATPDPELGISKFRHFPAQDRKPLTKEPKIPSSLKRQAEVSMDEAAKLRRTGSKNLDKVGILAWAGDFAILCTK